MTEQTDHAPSTDGFVDEWMTSKEICHEPQTPEQTFCRRRAKQAGPRAPGSAAKLASVARTSTRGPPPRKTGGMSEERRRPTRLTPATCRRVPHDNGHPVWIVESPSMATSSRSMVALRVFIRDFGDRKATTTRELLQ
jgi:hypothetical protein